jgi:hypothetical protein
MPSSQFELGEDHYTFKSIRVGRGSLYLQVNSSWTGILVLSKSIRIGRGNLYFNSQFELCGDPYNVKVNSR